MPDQFGGIEVDESPSTPPTIPEVQRDEFGGISVDDEALRLATTVPQKITGRLARGIELGALAQPEPPQPRRAVVTRAGVREVPPGVPLPGERPLSTDLERLAQSIPQGQNIITRPLSSLARTGLSFASAATAPENVPATVALASPLAPVAEAYFGYQMGKGAVESAKQIYDLMRQPGPVDEAFKQKLSDAIVNAEALGIGATGIGADLLRKAKNKVGGVVRPAPEEIRPAPTPVAPEAAPVAPAPAPTPLTAAEQAAERTRLAEELGQAPTGEFERVTKAQEELEAKKEAALGKGQYVSVLEQAGLTKSQLANVGTLSLAEVKELSRFANAGELNRENFATRLRQAKEIAARGAKTEAIDIASEVTPAPPILQLGPVPEVSVEPVSPAKPEVANLGDPSTKPNRFGDPAGTTYYATPEDWQAWQEHDARFKKISKDFIEAMRGGDPEKIAEAQKAQLEVGKEHEAFREKYGGMNPEPPKAPAAEQAGTKIKQVPTPERFDSIEELLKFRDQRRTEEVSLYREQIGLTEEEARQLQRLLADNRSTQKFESKLSEDKRQKLNAFFEGPLNQRTSTFEMWDFDKNYNPEELVGEEDTKYLSSALFSALADRFEASPTSDKFIYAAVAARRLKQLGVTQPDLARLLQEHSQRAGGNIEYFKIIAERLRDFLGSQGITFGEAVKPKPTAEIPSYTGADAIEIVGKPLGEWFKAKTAADLPKGAQRVELAGRIRAKSTKPKDILSALKNEQDRIRRVVTEMAKPPLSPEEAIPMVQPAPTPPTETPPPTPEVGPGPIGMGGAAAGEIQATGPRGEPTHGIAARVLEQRRQQGVIAPVEPGEGITPQESIERGRQLLVQGVDPEKILEDFNLTKAVSAEGIAVVRAQGERLARTAYAMADAHGIHSPEYEAAWEADSDWAKRTKPMQTEWHKIGQAQQGETEIDTGTFHGLRKAFLDATGKDFTPKQAKEAEGIAKGVKEATEAADKAKADVFAEVGKQARTTPETKPAAPKPGEIATPDSTTLWKRAKAMIDAGEDDFDALRHKLATEFGVPVEEVTRKLAEPKSAKKITDDMYRKMAEQRRMVSQAKGWLKNQQVPGWLRFMRSVPRIFFTAKILGHGTVGMITHAGLNIFNPVAWRTYWPNFFKQYRLVASKAYHERMMQDLLHDPLFTKARRAGLANDPFRFQDDYQTPTLIKWLDRIGITGNRGFDALKLFRQARFNQIWNSLPDTLQTPEYAKLLADSVNHSTGVIRRPFREWSNWTFFAPRLEASRWAWMVKDPWDAAKTFVDWNKASPAEKAFAMSQLKEKAVIAGTYYSLLMMNQGLLSASGSDQRINFDNPRRGDFLAFKAAGHNIGIVGPMLGMVRLFANLYHAAAGKRGKVEALTPRAAEFGQIGFEYARGKLSPFAGFGVDVVSQADFQGRPMPYSSDAVPKYLRRQGLDRYTYGEYAAQEFTPIPVSEAVREVWHDQGMGDDEINAWLKALTVGVAAGSTGARVSAETPPSTAK